jgi:preprotein translocase subunit YajC
MLEFLLQAQPAAPAGQGAPAQSPYGMLIMFGLIIGVFYFFMIRPQQKRQKEERNFRESLKKGDKIVTIGGIFGKITSIEESGVLVEVDKGITLKFDKAAIRPSGTEPMDSK